MSWKNNPRNHDVTWDRVQKSMPHAFLQHKGSDVCIDVRCDCGGQFHVDDDFCYFLYCPDCGRGYEVSSYLQLRELSPEEHAKWKDQYGDTKVAE